VEKVKLMHKMWNQAARYQRLIEWGYKHYRRFGLKRFLFRFSKVRARLERYENCRLMYVSMALAISRKLNAERRKQTILRKQRMDH
jgi:hypothetical protein